MKQESYQPDYGSTGYDLDFNFDLELSFSDYLLAAVYVVFILSALTLLRFVPTLFCKILPVKAPSAEKRERQAGAPGVLSFVSKIF